MPTSDYTPEVSAVGTLLNLRTKDGNGNVVGTFQDKQGDDEATATRPTATQVTELIAQAVGSVASRVGSTIPDAPDDPDAYRNAAKSLVALRAAMLVELIYFPEQVRSDRSAYSEYKDLYDEGLETLASQVAEEGGDTPPDEGGEVGSMSAGWYFPPDVGGLIGWETKW